MNSRVLLIEARRLLETAVRQRPDQPRYLELLGEMCLVSGDSLAAIPHLERVLYRERSPRATWLLAWAYVHAGRLADVERLVRELIEQDRGCARALYIRALARFKRRAFDLAIDDLREALPDEADVPFFRRELARALIGAALQGSTASPLGGRPAPAVNRAQLLNEAVALLRSGDIDDPESTAERAYLIGCALLELGESTRALSVLAETEYPDHAEASFRRGVAAVRDGDADTARACFGEAKQGPEIGAVTEQCLAALSRGKSLDGVTIPPPAIAPVGLGPLSSPGLVPLVIRGDGWPSNPWLVTLKPPPSFDDSPDQAPAVSYGEPEDQVEILRTALRDKRFDVGAIAECVALVERDDVDPALKQTAFRLLAMALQVDLRRPMPEVEQIMPLLMRVRCAHPGLAFPRLYVGRYWFRVRQYRRAIEELRDIPGHLWNRPVVRNMLGRSFEKLGRLDAAERAFRKSLRRKEDQPTIMYSLGRILLARYRTSCLDDPE